jgi:hypothetical protein
MRPLFISHFLFPRSNFPLPLFHLPCPRCDPMDGCRRSSSPEVSFPFPLLSPSFPFSLLARGPPCVRLPDSPPVQPSLAAPYARPSPAASLRATSPAALPTRSPRRPPTLGSPTAPAHGPVWLPGAQPRPACECGPPGAAVQPPVRWSGPSAAVAWPCSVARCVPVSAVLFPRAQPKRI